MIGLVRIVFALAWIPFTGTAAVPAPGAAAIAAAHPLATDAGRHVLAHGGNAFDAGVAIAAALAVVEPTSSGLGGGGFWLLHRARDGFEVMVDARERAPLAAREDMYLDKDRVPVPRLSLDGALAAGIPGAPAALVHIAQRYGRLPLAKTLAPAIALAREGFAVTPRYRGLTQQRREALKASSAAATVFLKDGEVPAQGDTIRQPQLARVLEQLVQAGRDGFYAGPTATQLVAGVRAAGGIWTQADLTDYRVVERPPVRGRYRGMRIIAASLPSSGGVVLIEMLNILQGYDLEHLPDITRTHVIIEAMRRAYRDRAQALGDPDFVPVDTRKLLSPEYAAQLRAGIDLGRATPSMPAPASVPADSAMQTTHFSVIDREGNRVSATLSINTPFGSAFMPPGTGILLNNEMDDFVIKPGVPNAYGLVGNKANAIAPGKRPLSSMTPTFLETPNAVVILGTPGGSRIITMVLLTALEFAHGRGDPQRWVEQPRFHHQYLPDELMYEPRMFSAAQTQALATLGHQLRERRPYGNMQVIAWYMNTNRLTAAADPRGEGVAWLEGAR